MRGYWGVALYHPSKEHNWGTILRSAYNFNANFIITIGRKYEQQASDTPGVTNHIPNFFFQDMEDFLKHRPSGCQVVRVEVDGERSLESFCHPSKAVYLFGPENSSLPKLDQAQSVRIQTNQCLNLAAAATVVMYDRHAKGLRKSWDV